MRGWGHPTAWPRLPRGRPSPTWSDQAKACLASQGLHPRRVLLTLQLPFLAGWACPHLHLSALPPNSPWHLNGLSSLSLRSWYRPKAVKLGEHCDVYMGAKDARVQSKGVTFRTYREILQPS